MPATQGSWSPVAVLSLLRCEVTSGGDDVFGPHWRRAAAGISEVTCVPGILPAVYVTIFLTIGRDRSSQIGDLLIFLFWSLYFARN